MSGSVTMGGSVKPGRPTTMYTFCAMLVYSDSLYRLLISPMIMVLKILNNMSQLLLLFHTKDTSLITEIVILRF